jgi:glycosyltransferase involved in cell wall biosynthesis
LGILKNPLLIWLARRLEMFLYRRASHLLVNSPAYRDYLISKGVPAGKVSFIANGVDPTLFRPESEGRALRQELGLDGKFVVTYAGALGISYDLETILNAAAEFRDQPKLHFLLVGDGRERGHLEKLASDLKLDNVTFTGAKAKRDIPEVLATSDVCVATLKNIPMFSTTYPNKIFDYMAAGRPIALAIDGVIRTVVETANAGIFVPPSDPRSLAAAIRWMYENQAAARAMGEAGRRHVERYFNRSHQAEQLSDLVERLTACRTANGRVDIRKSRSGTGDERADTVQRVALSA